MYLDKSKVCSLFFFLGGGGYFGKRTGPLKIQYTAFLFKYFFHMNLPLDPGCSNGTKMMMMNT